MLYFTLAILLFRESFEGVQAEGPVVDEIVIPTRLLGPGYDKKPHEGTRQFLEEVSPSTADSKELVIPAKYLGPKYYNNHPSEVARQYLEEEKPTKNGPVLFPNDSPPPRLPLVVTSRPLTETIARSDRPDLLQDILKPKTFKPAPAFRLKEAFKKRKSWSKAKQFLSKPPKLPNPESSTEVEDVDESEKKEPSILLPGETDENSTYAFSYKVKDHATGDDHSHFQRNQGLTTDGEYRVRLPDGRMQIVSYKADKKGYKANVRYDDSENKHIELSEKYEKTSDNDDDEDKKLQNGNSNIFSPDYGVLHKYRNVVHNLIDQPFHKTTKGNNGVYLHSSDDDYNDSTSQTTTTNDYCKGRYSNPFLCVKTKGKADSVKSADYSEFARILEKPVTTPEWSDPHTIPERTVTFPERTVAVSQWPIFIPQRPVTVSQRPTTNTERPVTEHYDDVSKLDYSEIVNTSPNPNDPDYHDVTPQLYIATEPKICQHTSHIESTKLPLNIQYPIQVQEYNEDYQLNHYQDNKLNDYQHDVVYVTPRLSYTVKTNATTNQNYSDEIYQSRKPQNEYVELTPQLDPALYDYAGVIPVPKQMAKHEAIQLNQNYKTNTGSNSVTQTVYNKYDHLLNSYTLKPSDLLNPKPTSVSSTTVNPIPKDRPAWSVSIPELSYSYITTGKPPKVSDYVQNDFLTTPKWKDYNDMDVELAKDYKDDYSFEAESEINGYPPHRSKFINAFYKHDSSNASTARSVNKETSARDKTIVFNHSISPNVDIQVHSTGFNPSSSIDSLERVVTIAPRPINYSNGLNSPSSTANPPLSYLNNYVGNSNKYVSNPNKDINDPIKYVNDLIRFINQKIPLNSTPKTSFDTENHVTDISYQLHSTTPKGLGIIHNHSIFGTPSTYVEPRTTTVAPLTGVTPKSYLESTIASLNDRINHKPVLNDHFKNKIYSFTRY